MLRNSLSASFFAFFPSVLSSFIDSPQIFWMVASGCLALYLGGISLPNIYRAWDREMEARSKVSFRGLAIFFSMALTLQLANVSGWPAGRGEGLYLAAITWLAVAAGYHFMHLVLRAAD